MLFRDKLVLNVDNVTYNRFKRPCAATTNLVVVLFLLIGLAPVSASPTHAAEGNTVDSQPTSDSNSESDPSDSENPATENGDDAVSSDEEVEAASDEEGAAEEEAPADKSEDEVAEKEAPADDSAETEKESSSDGSSEEESPASESTAEGAPSDEGDITEEAVPATSEEETAEEASSEETTSEESPEAEEPTDEKSSQEDAPEEEPVDTKPADEKPADEEATAVEESAVEEAEPSEEPEIEPTVSVEEEPVVEIEPDDSQTASRPLPIVDEQEVTPEEIALQKRVIGATATLMEKQSELLFEARIDTGAKSCSLHVEKLVIEDEAEKMVDNIGKIIRFMVKNNKGESDWIESKIDGYVIIKSGSDSRKDQRYKVPVTFRWKDVEKTVSVTLTDRSHMEYPLLVGRNFLLGQFVVDVELDNND